MKLVDKIKKYKKFLSKLDLPDKVIAAAANELAKTEEGDRGVFLTPLAKSCPYPLHFMVEWDIIFDDNRHKMNPTLIKLEESNRLKFGPRSIAASWALRKDDLLKSYRSQNDKHIPITYPLRGEGDLAPISMWESAQLMKSTSSAGFPFLVKKGKVLDEVLANFDKYYDRKDPCALFTRTTECEKTRNVWAFPLVDTLYEMRWYQPLLWLQKKRWYRAALVSPDTVAKRITELILKAKATNRIIYSLDCASFDANVKYQYIIAAFEYIASCFAEPFRTFIVDKDNPDEESLCKRFYTIPIVTPQGVLRGKHGVPSGSTFTNEVDSIVQLCIALTCDFIKQNECQVQGDDGVYIMLREHISAFQKGFNYAGHDISNDDKNEISPDYAMFCQNLYHIDYIDDNGVINGIYPVYRALCRIMYQERFVNFTKAGIKGQDYYGIRCMSILENTKYHPLHEDLVRFVYSKEQFGLEITDDGLMKYCSKLMSASETNNLNHQYGSDVSGIRQFSTYKIVQKIMSENRAVEDNEN